MWNRFTVVCTLTYCVSSADAVVDLPAGQKRCSGPSYIARFLETGMLSFFKVRWAGWSPSWLVPLRATDESRSKLIFPSGLGYSIGVQSLAGFSWFASRPETDWTRLVTKCWFFYAEIRSPDTIRNHWYCASSHHTEETILLCCTCMIVYTYTVLYRFIRQ